MTFDFEFKYIFWCAESRCQQPMYLSLFVRFTTEELSPEDSGQDAYVSIQGSIK